MRAHMTWLDEAEKQSFVEEALGILERVGVELKGSAALPVLADLGADVDPSTGVVRLPARPRAARRRGVPAPRALRRRVAGARRGPGRGRAGALLLVGLRRLRARPRDRRQASLHARRPAGGHDPARRGARGRRDVDDDHGERRAGRGPRAGGLLRRADRGAQARDPRRQPVTGRAAAAHHGRGLRRRRGVPRAAAVQHAAHRGVSAAHRRAAPRLPRGHGAARGARRGVHRAHGRRHLAGDAGGDHRPGAGRVPRRRDRPAGAGPRGARRHGRLRVDHGHALGRRLLRLARMRADERRLRGARASPGRAGGGARPGDRRQVRRPAGRLREGAQGPGDGRRRRRRAERRRGHDRLGQHAVPAADRAGRGGGRDDPPHPRRRRHPARRDDGRHDRAGRHRRRLPQGEGDRAAAAGRRALHRRGSRRARPTTSGSRTGATRWRGPGSAWTRSSRPGPSAAVRSTTPRGRSSPGSAGSPRRWCACSETEAEAQWPGGRRSC